MYNFKFKKKTYNLDNEFESNSNDDDLPSEFSNFEINHLDGVDNTFLETI